MGVYNTLTYNPLGSIQTAISNVNERNRIKRDYWKNKADIWSNSIKGLASIAGKALDYYQAYKEDPETKLAALQKELEEAEHLKAVQHLKEVQDKYNQQVAQRKAFDEYALRDKGVYEAEHLKEVQDKYNQQVAQRKAFDEYALRDKGVYEADKMQDYKPNIDDSYVTYLGAINNYSLPYMQDYYRRGR